MKNARFRHVSLAALAGLLFVLYIGALHVLTAEGQPSVLGGALALVPIGLTTLWLAWLSAHRRIAVGVWLTALVLLTINRDVLAHQFQYIQLIQHAGSFACLAVVFGRTLLADRTPMIAVFARTVHGSLPPPLAAYTRKATVAWTLFFAAMTSASLLLFFTGRIAHWSLLANVLTPGIIAAMFLGEYAIRCQVLPRDMRANLITSIRAAWPGLDRLATGDTPQAKGSSAAEGPAHTAE